MIRLAIPFLLAFFTISLPANAQETTFNKAKLDRYLQLLYKNDKMMGSFAIRKNGQYVYSNAVGYKQTDDEKGDLANANTKYRIGSVTKMFTATLIFTLIEDDKLALDTKLASFYPEIPNAKQITIRQLLTHQSGLLNITRKKTYQDWKEEEMTKKALLDTFRTDKPQFDPGEKMKYSNTNYILLGYILEEIASEPYGELLQKRILSKVGVDNTYFAPETQDISNPALSYRYRKGKWTSVNFTDLSIPHGAGAIVSTPKDITKFAESLFEQKLVTQKSLDSMMALDEGMGKGLIPMPFYGKQLYGHTGGIDGFAAILSYSPADSVAFAATFNALNYSMNDILKGILSIYYERDFELPTFQADTFSLAQDQMGGYEGVYASDKISMEITVEEKDGQLTAKATDQQSFPLNATSDTTFKYERAGVKIEFQELRQKEYQKIILYQRGAEIPFTRE